MKLTRHNGRSGKHGTYNPRHNDRRFDVENSEHIDACLLYTSTIALAVKTGKLTAQVLQAAIRKYLAARQKGTGKAHHGQQSLRQLKKDGSALSNIEITDANIGLFKPCAKKYESR